LSPESSRQRFTSAGSEISDRVPALLYDHMNAARLFKSGRPQRAGRVLRRDGLMLARQYFTYHTLRAGASAVRDDSANHWAIETALVLLSRDSLDFTPI
jgi:hypothetical protein